MNQAYKRHGMRKRPQKMKRKARGSTIMGASEARIVLRYFLPNA
jgi:large subunit ribosomal protein L35